MTKTITRLVLAIPVLAIGYVLWFGVPGSAPEVRVECVGAGDAVSCTTEHTAGRTGASACWDVVFTCSNGTTAEAHKCDTVDRGSRSVVRIPLSAFTNAASCEPAGSKVQNLLVTPI